MAMLSYDKRLLLFHYNIFVNDVQLSCTRADVVMLDMTHTQRSKGYRLLTPECRKV